MTMFSKRYGYNPQNPSEPILEDAPSWLRVGYINQILNPFTYIDDDSRYENKSGSPVGIKALNETICVHFRMEIDAKITDSWYCVDFLHDLIKTSEWYQFYDIVEIVGQKAKEVEAYWRDSKWAQLYAERIEKYSFQSYRRAVNELFTTDNVSWRLDDDGYLKRELPEALGHRVETIQKELTDEFEPAREHYKKAIRYANARPIDPENSIKEIVSAVESVGRVLYPKATTLGDVVREMRKANILPQHLVSVIEKFYAYACAEPAVRHGAPTSSKVVLDDAEFCLHLGAALIRYLIAYAKRQHQEKSAG